MSLVQELNQFTDKDSLSGIKQRYYHNRKKTRYGKRLKEVADFIRENSPCLGVDIRTKSGSMVCLDLREIEALLDNHDIGRCVMSKAFYPVGNKPDIFWMGRVIDQIGVHIRSCGKLSLAELRDFEKFHHKSFNRLIKLGLVEKTADDFAVWVGE